MSNKKPEQAEGFGIRVDGGMPYLSHRIEWLKGGVEPFVTEKYHRIVPVVLITRREWFRLRRKAKEIT